MEFFFESDIGPNFSIKVANSDTVLQIKENIHENQGIPIANQTLLFNGDALNDDELIIHHHPESPAGSCLRLIDSFPLLQPSNETTNEPSPVSDSSGGSGLPPVPFPAHLATSAAAAGLPPPSPVSSSSPSPASASSGLPPPFTVPSSSSGVSPSPDLTLSESSAGSSKLRIIVVVTTDSGVKRLPMEVNFSDTPEDLRTLLMEMNERLKLDLEDDEFFFVHSLRHNAQQGDEIEVFSGR